MSFFLNMHHLFTENETPTSISNDICQVKIKYVKLFQFYYRFKCSTAGHMVGKLIRYCIIKKLKNSGIIGIKTALLSEVWVVSIHVPKSMGEHHFVSFQSIYLHNLTVDFHCQATWDLHLKTVINHVGAIAEYPDHFSRCKLSYTAVHGPQSRSH